MEKLPLPKGKLNIRHRQMRNVFQCFAGKTYLAGASGDSPKIAADELAYQYEVPEGSTAIVHGLKNKFHITIPTL